MNRFMIREAIAHRGERVEEHHLDARVDGSWVQVASGKTIGNKRILRFPAVSANAFKADHNKDQDGTLRDPYHGPLLC